jgi:hypothetical protein
MMRELPRYSTNLEGITSQGQSNVVILPYRISELWYVSHQDEMMMVTKCSSKSHTAYTRLYSVVRTEGAASL